MMSIGCTQVGSHEFLTVCVVDEDQHDAWVGAQNPKKPADSSDWRQKL